MTTYRAKVNHDIALASLTTLNPQPRSEGVRPTQRDFVLDGTLVDQGSYVEFIFDMVESVTQYQAILTVFGLHNATTKDVTIYCRNEIFDWKRYNGKAIRPIPSWENYFPRGVTILVRNLELLA